MIPDIIMHLQTLQALAESKAHEANATDEQVLYVKDYIKKIESEIAYLKELQGSFNEKEEVTDASVLLSYAKEVKDQMLMDKYDESARAISFNILDFGYSKQEPMESGTTFPKTRRFIAYLRKTGFTVTLLKIKHEWRRFYSLQYVVTYKN